MAYVIKLRNRRTGERFTSRRFETFEAAARSLAASPAVPWIRATRRLSTVEHHQQRGSRAQRGRSHSGKPPVRPRGDGDPVMRLGLTVSKKVGGAVVRNRMKRRFRELARLILPEAGLAGADHVLIGRQGGIERPYDQLAADLERALAKLRK